MRKFQRIPFFFFRSKLSSSTPLTTTMHPFSNTSSKALRRAAAKARPSLTRGAHKEIKFSNEGRASILKGVDVLANAVSVTLGPKGVHLSLSNFLFKLTLVQDGT